MHEHDPPVTNGEARAAALIHVKAAHEEAEAAIQTRIAMIRSARDFGASWHDVGEAMGMSRQTAHKRFGQYVD